MNLDQAQTLARELIEQHLGRGWRIEWNDSDRLFGGCQPNRRAIQLSRHFVRRCSRDEVVDTILHEIAHGLTPSGVKPHGAEWQAAAQRLGARPDPCKDTLIYPHLTRMRSHRRQWATVGAAAVLIAAAVFAATSVGSGPKPKVTLGTVPVVSATTSTTAPQTIITFGTTTTTSPIPAVLPSAPPTTTIRTTAKQTPKTATTTPKVNSTPAAPAAPATPAPTTTTAPPPPVTTTTYGCYKDADGNCVQAEELCPSDLYNQTVAGAEGPITCTKVNGVWEWEYS